MRLVAFVAITVLVAAVVLLQMVDFGSDFTLYLDKSVPFIGAKIPQMDGIDGTGIRVAVIDSGVDYYHPSLIGWGPHGKVIGGHNFINPDHRPIDTDGHGTQVAGVIAADGQVTGVAPKAKILAYKVTEGSKGASTDLISKAIDKAIDDGADIINISLGTGKIDEKIERAISRAFKQGVFVVTAAGNEGPDISTIGSPGRNPGSITVGATYNNLVSSLIATLEVDGKQYTVTPMIGSYKLDMPIHSEIISVGYASVEDLIDKNVYGKILLAERGSSNDELLYFSIKEENSANAGASALIVYNNEHGTFLGELTHEFADDDYTPRIPVVSIDRKDGLEIKDLPMDRREGILHLFYNPDFVAHFSSRGPVSPFHIKPDLVAPGAYINSTYTNLDYRFASGTSLATPHVSGAAALLMQKYPSINNNELKALLLTTAKPVFDEYGNEFSIHDSGSGRLDIEKAFAAKLIIQPPNLIANLSSLHPTTQMNLSFKMLEGTLDELTVSFDGPDFIEFEKSLKEDTLSVIIRATSDSYGEYESRITITHDGINYIIPVIIHYTKGTIDTILLDEQLVFDITHPNDWSFAKITVMDSSNGMTRTVTATKDRPASLPAYKNTEYIIEANIRSDGKSHDAFNTITVDSLLINRDHVMHTNIPEKQFGMILCIVLIVGTVAAVIKKT